MKYQDGLGHVYEVPEDSLLEFERRRNRLLWLAVIGKSFVLIAIIWWLWN